MMIIEKAQKIFEGLKHGETNLLWVPFQWYLIISFSYTCTLYVTLTFHRDMWQCWTMHAGIQRSKMNSSHAAMMGLWKVFVCCLCLIHRSRSEFFIPFFFFQFDHRCHAFKLQGDGKDVHFTFWSWWTCIESSISFYITFNTAPL